MERPLKLLFASLAVLVGSAPSAKAAPGETETFALVVTNNRSTTLALPDLQYADDDGARYYRLFRSVAGRENVVLLTTFDRSTAALYPELVAEAQAPTQTGIEAAVDRLGRAAAAARSRGAKTTFYFVYAGHGDVDEGRGYLDLEDGRVDGSFIESAILEKIPADTKHVLLDSCNSFFVMNPRKPGGRRWATPQDMALGFAKRHPEVGLFLSTNSDAEVFEWSELESGVFSHEVRSGLSGAADVDGDGSVSYAELAGFVDRANARIARDTLRPHIYYRGPSGESQASLFSPSKSAGRRLVLGDAAMRLWVKSENGERLLDLHKEQGPLTLVLPAPASQGFTVHVVEQAASEVERPVVREHAAPAGEGEIRLAELTGARPSVSSRGNRLFGSLFAMPYGPLAYREFLTASDSQPETVYGISEKDAARMHNYIAAMADSDRKSRRLTGTVATLFGGALAAGALVSYADSPRWSGIGSRGESIAFAITGGLIAGAGISLFATRSAGELALDTFEKEAAAGRDRPAAFAKTEQALENLARRDRRNRWIVFCAWEAAGLGYATWATVGLVHPASGDAKLQPSGATILYGISTLFLAGGFAMLSLDLPTERLLKLYRKDSDLQLRLGATPTPSGAAVGLSGRF